MMKLALERRSIALYVDVARASARDLAREIAESFQKRSFTVAACGGQERALEFVDDGVSADEASLFITVGGDGTLLRAARIATENNVPLLGVNTGRLGFLTELDAGDSRIAELPAMVEEGLVIDERSALEAEYDGHRYFALNDVVVRKGDVSRIVPFGLKLDSEHIADIPADGICIATPTGSTAYFLSAGGPIISPRVDAFGIVPLLPHTLFSRPLIVPGSSRIEISSDSEVAHAHLECDGDVLAVIAPDSCVSIRRNPKTVRFARLAPLRFFERLEQKMRWGVSIKATSR
ncbi:MAG: NAD(+)/NADH kinase [Candidatus Eremiobacteraeota bacterium]|nr:NAD(+)/NADH kinase [Candidatus Eremiobacteraeota bacterium]